MVSVCNNAQEVTYIFKACWNLSIKNPKKLLRLHSRKAMKSEYCNSLQIELLNYSIYDIQIKTYILTLVGKNELFALHYAIFLVSVYFLKIFEDVIAVFHHPKMLVIENLPCALIQNGEIRVHSAVALQVQLTFVSKRNTCIIQSISN